MILEEAMISDEGPVYPKPPEDLMPFEEWKYTMRRTMQEIVPGVFLGPYSAAMKSKYETLKEAGVTGIVCVRHSVEAQIIKPNFQGLMKYLILEIADSTSENIIKHFGPVKDFVDRIHSEGGKVLIHGNAGISRSAALTLAFVMETYGLSLKKAYDIVLHRRYCVNINSGFMTQLNEFEPIYKANRMIQYWPRMGNTVRNKRPCDVLED